MTFIHQEKTWPDFQWDMEILDPLLTEVKQKLNFLFTASGAYFSPSVKITLLYKLSILSS